VARHDDVVLEAGSHLESMRLRTSDLIMVAGATVADISEEH
jgi:prolyl-tRNA editing enzyme YbaK/EbsC (Cys-tRNA(Pro) deacylase)